MLNTEDSSRFKAAKNKKNPYENKQSQKYSKKLARKY